MFEKTELVHMLISVITVSLAFSIPFFISFPLVFATVGLGFLLHEIAHKITAIRFGCVAVYRAWMEGLVLAVLFAFATGGRFVFAAPGAVYIFKPFLTRRENGLISVAGPAMNILLAMGFALFMLIPNTTMQLIGAWGYTVNIFLAFFNMLPIPPLDGSKVLGWNPAVWFLVIALAGVGFFFKEAFLGVFFSLI
jgi:Zn-dependent protease